MKNDISELNKYIEILDEISEQYIEEEIEYNYSFDNYLLDALRSGIGLFFKDINFKENANATVVCVTYVLDLLSDYIVDQYSGLSREEVDSILERSILIHEEVTRIRNDLELVHNNYKEFNMLLIRRNEYHNLKIEPLNDMVLLEL